MSPDRNSHPDGTGIDIEAVMDLSDIIASLQDLSDDELKLKGMAVEGTLDEMDDPVLLGPDGAPVDTWKGLPVPGPHVTPRVRGDKEAPANRIAQGPELGKRNRQEDRDGLRGRDAVNKGGTIKLLHGAPEPSRRARVVALNKPTLEESAQWYFQRYIKHLPSAAKSSSSTVPGTTGQASSGSWASAPMRNTKSS